MNRLIFFIGICSLAMSQAYGQCVVTKDARGRVITTCELYFPGGEMQGHLMRPSRKEAIYEGSEYLGYPILQEGTLELGGKALACQLTYNLMTSEVLAILPGRTNREKVFPDAFTMAGLRFVKQVNRILGREDTFYAIPLYEGSTRFYKAFKCTLTPAAQENGYSRPEEFDGYFESKTVYYLRKPNQQSYELVALNRRAILAALRDAGEDVEKLLPKRNLTTQDVVKALKLYDSMASASASVKGGN